MDKAAEDLKKKWLEPHNKARRSEQENRLKCLLPYTEIAGLKCQQFKPIHYVLLEGSDNAFVVNTTPTLGDIVAFLWTVSLDYQIGTFPPKAFFKKVKSMPLVETLDSIENYINSALDDLRYISSEQRPKGASYTYWVTTYFSGVGDWQQVLSTPFGVLAQIVRNKVIAQGTEANPHGVLNPSDRYTEAYRREYLELQKQRKALLETLSNRQPDIV
jgi:hypothetical protein